MADYNNTYKNDVFLRAYEKDRKGGEELGFLRVFTTTSLFQRLTFRDKFNEDEDDIRLFKKYARIERDDDKWDLEKFDTKKTPTYDCMPFYDLIQRSHEEWKKQYPTHWTKQNTDEQLNKTDLLIYMYGALPQ